MINETFFKYKTFEEKQLYWIIEKLMIELQSKEKTKENSQ